MPQIGSFARLRRLIHRDKWEKSKLASWGKRFSVLPLLRHSLFSFPPVRVNCVMVQWLWCVWTSVKWSGWFNDKDDFCRYHRCRPSETHIHSHNKRRYQIQDIKDISDISKSTREEDHYVQSNIDIWCRLKVEAACWQSSRILWSVLMLQPGELLLRECGPAWSSETFQTGPSVFLSHWRTAGCSTGRALRTWLRVLNSRYIECQKPVSMFLPGCFSMLILLPADTELKASIALIQPSTLPRLSSMKNNFKISVKKKTSSLRFPRCVWMCSELLFHASDPSCNTINRPFFTAQKPNTLSGAQGWGVTGEV